MATLKQQTEGALYHQGIDGLVCDVKRVRRGVPTVRQLDGVEQGKEIQPCIIKAVEDLAGDMKGR